MGREGSKGDLTNAARRGDDRDRPEQAPDFEWRNAAFAVPLGLLDADARDAGLFLLHDNSDRQARD